MKVSTRGRSPSHSPKLHAIWTLSALRSEFDHFFTEVFPDTEHEGIRGLPGPIFAKSVADQGERPIRFISYDDSFLIVTMPLFGRALKVHHNRGIRINYLWYWVRDFADSKWRNKKVPVRYDPQDGGYVEALLGTHWVRCKCTCPLINGYPWREIESLTQECLAEARQTNKRKRLTPIMLERYIARVRAKEVELERQKREKLAAPEPADGKRRDTPSPTTKQRSAGPKRRTFVDTDFEPQPIVRIGGSGG